jgi:methylthioribose-1-phosphate isomerase
MQTEPKTDTTPADELTHELALVSDQVRALADPTGAVDTIVVALDRLYAQGADDQALADIQTGGEQLLAITDASTQALRGAVELAQRIKQQRDQAEDALQRLRQAMDALDTDMPEIQALFESVEEMLMDETWEYIYDTLWETVYDRVFSATPLDYRESVTLTDYLTDGCLPLDHPLWDELRAWMAKVEACEDYP